MKKLLFALFLPAVMLTACSEDQIPGPTPPDNKVQVNFASDISAIQDATRVSGATGTMWDGTEHVGIYMVGADGALTAANVLADNNEYTATSGETATFSPVTAPMYYPEDGSSVKFVSYYPYSAAVSNYILPVSVADQSVQSDIDLLYSPISTTGYDNTQTTPVNLGFSHQLSKLILNIIPQGDLTVTDLAGATIQITNQHQATTFDIAAGTLAPATDTPAALDAVVVTDAQQYQAIALPGDLTDVQFAVTLPSNGKTYTTDAVLPEISAWNGGYMYTYTIKLGAGSTSIELTGTIAPWGDGGSGELIGTETGGEENPTIADVLAAGVQDEATVSGTVVAINKSGMMIADETGAIQVYGQKPDVAINDAITATGSTAMYHGVLEFKVSAATDITVTGTGSYTLPEPIAMDGAAVTAYVATAMDNTAVYQYVTYTGQYVVDGNYVDVVIDGTTTQGNVVGADPAWAEFDGQQVTVTGWLMGGTTNFMDTMATSVEPVTVEEGPEATIKMTPGDADGANPFSTMYTLLGSPTAVSGAAGVWKTSDIADILDDNSALAELINANGTVIPDNLLDALHQGAVGLTSSGLTPETSYTCVFMVTGDNGGVTIKTAEASTTAAPEMTDLELTGLVAGEMDYYGDAYNLPTNNYANWNIYLGDNANLNNATKLIQLELNTAKSATTELTPGTYEMMPSRQAPNFVAFSMVPGYLQAVGNDNYIYGTALLAPNQAYNTTAGTVTVAKSGTNYTITFDIEAPTDGLHITGTYTGPLTYQNGTASMPMLSSFVMRAPAGYKSLQTQPQMEFSVR